MSLGSDLAQQLPYLRRYARALTGSQDAGDALVKAMLEAALEDSALKVGLGGGRVAVYCAFGRFWQAHSSDAASSDRLQSVTPRNRQALLLTTLEEFSAEQAAEIMGIPPGEVDALVQDALGEIEREHSTSVLVIEDEPLIAMQLEELVSALGHEVCGTAATRDQAREVVSRCVPGLVLADIQLADGSSGLDAVDDILAVAPVPVIFITAYPERLLTGCRKEPAYLVTKPFREATVRAAISQALFFAETEAPA